MIPASADEFFHKFLNSPTNIKFRKVTYKPINTETVHEHFDQYYKGILVEGAGYNFHYYNGVMFYAHGNYISIESLDVQPKVTIETAKKTFTEYKGIPTELVTDFKAELILKEISNSKFSENKSVKLVYRIYLFANHPNNNEVGYIDAQTGILLYTEPTLINVSATGTFATRYSGQKSGKTDYNGSSYYLADYTRGNGIHTWNLNGSINYQNDRQDLIDNDNNWTATEYSSNKNDMALDIHWGLQQIYDFLLNKYAINSFDNQGQAINAYIKYGNTTGDKDNSSWDPFAENLIFGVGDVVYRPLSSLDIVAHEYGHGISTHQIGWSASDNVTLAFSEGLSDIWAAILEYRIKSNNIWSVGEQVTLNNSCIRNIQNTMDPNAVLQIANTFESSKYYDSSNYNAISYIKSGVFSHWFYLLVNGGVGTNDIGNSYQVYGIGMDAAEDLIIDAVFNGFLRYTVSYGGLSQAFISLAETKSPALAQQVKNAWYAVGVGEKPTQVQLTGPSQFCSQGSYTINYLPNGSIISWTETTPAGIVSCPSSGNPVTVTKINNGKVTLKAKIDNVVTLTEDISVGVPFSLGINSYSNLTMWDASDFQVLASSGYYPYEGTLSVSDVAGIATNYSWSFVSSTSGKPAYWWANVNSVDIAMKQTNTFLTLKCTASDTCGSYSQFYTFTTSDLIPMLITPNPATTEVEVSIADDNNAVTSTNSASPSYTVTVVDSYGSTVYSNTTKEKKFKIRTASFRNGIYAVTVSDGINIYQNKLAVKH